ncbi:hypothetical protein QOZ80_5BG0435590 [Eleusine coracana subsp. coracana]|nr:hypothetical protein QOZ80_5BG0435590 [Eleusine coracana subsp. coracana]
MHEQVEAHSVGNLHNPTPNDNVHLMSVGCNIPAATAECSEPISPMHFDLGVPQRANSNNATSDNFKAGDLGGIPIFASTQDDTGYIIRMRPRIDRIVNIPERYRSPFKCITHRPAIDMVKGHAVRRKFCTELKTKLKCVMHQPSEWLTCKDVVESFEDGAQLNKSFMSYFIECICVEEETFRPNCVGFRVFLSGCLGEMLSIDEERYQSKYPDLAALVRLESDIHDLDLYKVKLFFVPIPEDNHYTIYCLNMIDFHIDILDSSNEDHEDYHTTVSDRVVPRLNELFQKVTCGKFRDFSKWKRPVTRVMRENVPNDSPFISMKVMKIWDGQKLHSKENQINMADLRSKMLFYMLYNLINQLERLPYGLEAYRPIL